MTVKSFIGGGESGRGRIEVEGCEGNGWKGKEIEMWGCNTTTTFKPKLAPTSSRPLYSTYFYQ
jgi:hypothetical protein